MNHPSVLRFVLSLGSFPSAARTTAALGVAVLACTAALWTVPEGAHAHEVFASLVPNPVTAVNSEGRVRPCINCHNNPDGGAGCASMPCLNPFGMAFRANMFSWNAALAMMDSDGDGFTNGQELQDPFGTWSEGPYPGVASLVTPPGNPAFTPGDMDPDRDGYCAFGLDMNGDHDCRDAGENEGSLDCNESSMAIHSGATEVCSNVGDDDCDGLPTLQDTECVDVVDRDGDGRCVMGTDTNADRNCAGPGESSATIVDCDDTRANVYLNARENCADTVDNDCDGMIDLMDGQCQGDSDVDGDGYCPVGRDNNDDGDCVDAGEIITSVGDCDDENVAVNPDAAEATAVLCGDGLDNECDGAADLNDAECRVFADEDGDGYCPSGRDGDGDGDCTGATDVAGGGDCDDFNPGRSPGLTESCIDTARVDEDCDGAINLADVGADGRAESTCLGYMDRDGDGYCFVGPDRNRDGDCVDSMEFGFASDCDEVSPLASSINPTRPEICFDTTDNDCDGSTDASDPACAAYRDDDHDGVCVTGRDMNADGDCADMSEQTAETDMAPTDPTIWPGAPENCIDRKDNDQDGTVDRDDDDCAGAVDLDGDGYCSYGRDANDDGDCLDAGEDSVVSDCDESTLDVGPLAEEVCGNFRDDDCDGDVDLFDLACFFQLDRDRDGFCGMGVDDNHDGDCVDEAEDRFGVDCDDTVPEVNPNATEDCMNRRDDDCDGAADDLDTQCACTMDADCDDGDACTIDTCRSAGRGCSYERALACIDTGGLPDAGETPDAGGPPPASGGCAASPRATHLGLGLFVLVACALAARRRRLVGALAVIGCLAMAPSQALAYSAYQSSVPNGTVNGCLTCHNNASGGGGCASPPCWNPFGAAFAASNGAAAGGTWSATLAGGNADGDYWTNGQELLDPDGDGIPTGSTIYVTLPGFTTSAMADCTLNYDTCDSSPDACVEISPTFLCSCPSGYSGTGMGAFGCSDVNECSSGNPCLEDSGFGNICTNSTGSYSCDCDNTRFTEGGTSCIDRNECTSFNYCLEDTVAGNSCSNTTGRFDCTCGAQGYTLSNNGGYPETCIDINECAGGSPCAEDYVGSPNTCTNLTPRYNCVCGAGFTETGSGGFSEACVDNNECLTTPGICGAGSCANTAGSYTCTCPSGYRAPPSGGTCANINECMENTTICGMGSCSDTVGAYTCACAMGYSFNGVTCVVNNACTAGTDDCDPVATCTPVGSMSWTCACPSGYAGNGYTPPPAGDTGCSDINECVTMPTVCGVGTCRNTGGTYLCACPSGYTAPVTGGTCTDVNECTMTPGLCGAGTCTNLAGTYACSCPPGYSGPATGGTCTDVDECRVTSTCNAASGWGACSNTIGGYACTCAPGFDETGTGLSLTCTNVDECTTAPPCGAGTCSDTVGSYRCTCPVGYTGVAMGGTCTDVDECVGGTACSASAGNGLCVNTPGAYDCSCFPGFARTGSGRSIDCTNVDECATGAAGCDTHATCADAVPSFGAPPFFCTCIAGWEGDGFVCTDTDECGDPMLNDCSPLASCDNQDGTYGCTCNPGYEGNGFECADIDECGRSPAPCAPEELCLNQVGVAPLCECRPGFDRPEGGGPCTTSCGNGRRVMGEECDDGNTANGDGCSDHCVVEDGWVCFEDPTASVCSYTCGDGVLDPLSGEECDEGVANGDEPNACRDNCRLPSCGDEVVDDGEACDDGLGGMGDTDGDFNSDHAANGCRMDCRAAFCGDGVLDDGEYCDRATDPPAGGFPELPIESCTIACLPDAGPSPDAGVIGADVGPPVMDGGCACRVQHRSMPSALVGLVGVLWALLRARRR